MHDTSSINNPTGSLETGGGGAMSKGTLNMGTLGNLADMPSLNLDFLGVGGDGGAVNVNGMSQIITNKVHIGNGSPLGTMNMHDMSMMPVNGWLNIGAWSGNGVLNMDGLSSLTVTDSAHIGWHAIGLQNGTGTVNMSGLSTLSILVSDYWGTFLAGNQ